MPRNTSKALAKYNGHKLTCKAITSTKFHRQSIINSVIANKVYG